jgi:hypothetical protein
LSTESSKSTTIFGTAAYISTRIVAVATTKWIVIGSKERLAQIIPPAVYTADDDNDKAIDMLHSIMFGYSRSKPIPTFEHKLATFEKEFLQ